jgi:putative membrane protein
VAGPGLWQDKKMKGILTKIAINATAIWLATLVIPELEIGGKGRLQIIVTLLLIGLIFGALNTIIKPIVKLLALPFYFLTLGLFSFVVNAGLLALTAGLAGDAFNVGSFMGGALPAAILVTFISIILNFVMTSDRKN